MKRAIYLRLGRADLPVRLFPAPIRTNRATSKPKQADQQIRPAKFYPCPSVGVCMVCKN